MNKTDESPARSIERVTNVTHVNYTLETILNTSNEKQCWRSAITKRDFKLDMIQWTWRVNETVDAFVNK